MNLITLLLIASAAMPLGALMGLYLARRPERVPLLEGLTAGVLAGVLALHLLPESFEKMGWTATIPILAGYLAITLLERGAHHSDHAPKRLNLPGEIVWLCLVLHQIHDGFVLTMSSSSWSDDSLLALAVVVHRLPMAAIIFWMDFREGRVRTAWLRLTVMTTAMLASALFADSLATHLHRLPLDWLFALSAGSFIHILGHDFLARLTMPRARFALILGGALTFLAHLLIP